MGATPIEQIEFPLNSRDELPPVLRALQYIYATPDLNKKVFKLLEKKIMSGIKATGRLGMSLWEILVFASIRLALDADYDRLQHIANYDSLVRSLVGISNFGEKLKKYPLRTLKGNVSLLDKKTIEQIDKLVSKSAHRLLNVAKLNVKIDSYVLETNVHFPTDFNLLWDASRKSIELVGQIYKSLQVAGWRKYKAWRNKIKRAYHKAAKSCRGAGKHTDKGLNAAIEYLSFAEQLSHKLNDSIELLHAMIILPDFNFMKLNNLIYFKNHIDKHVDLVRRRIIFQETIPHDEKIFSLFEPYTEWIKKGKTRNQVELGLRIAIATDQFGFILRYRVMQQEQDVDIAVPFANELLSQYNIDSISFDKGFWSPENYDKLANLVDNLIMPKKGKLNKLEQQRQQDKTFSALRHQHAAVESAINCLEHHGLNRCPDKGIDGFGRYTALGVLAYNLHKLGNILLAQDKKQLSKSRAYSEA
ncbi:MAG: ISNCY family transposase, partial [Promethearchaeota archaeon]